MGQVSRKCGVREWLNPALYNSSLGTVRSAISTISYVTYILYSLIIAKSRIIMYRTFFLQAPHTV